MASASLYTRHVGDDDNSNDKLPHWQLHPWEFSISGLCTSWSSYSFRLSESFSITATSFTFGVAFRLSFVQVDWKLTRLSLGEEMLSNLLRFYYAVHTSVTRLVSRSQSWPQLTVLPPQWQPLIALLPAVAQISLPAAFQSSRKESGWQSMNPIKA